MKQEFQEIPINKIHTRENYRKTFNDRSLAELAQSIRQNGVIEPIIVRPNNDGFEIIAGERRFRASQLAKLVTIPALVRESSDNDVLKLQIIENVQREGVQFMEEAYALKKLRSDLSLDVAEIARMIGKSESYVYLMLQLTEMSEDAQKIASNGWIRKAVAFHISKLANTDYQSKAANDLARTKRDQLITENGAKSYIRDTFQADSERAMRKKRRSVTKADGNDFVANWKHYLVNFSCEQFETFKTVVRGRTQTEILAEAVDVVMRGGANR
jgi:ParB family transcriptional regulator, chromosome partitioning protein